MEPSDQTNKKKSAYFFTQLGEREPYEVGKRRYFNSSMNSNEEEHITACCLLS